MNREIKFRAWDKVDKRMVSPDELKGQEVYLGTNGFLYLLNYPKLGKLGRCPGMELQQFTGLKDKNDTEIYEGDILKLYEDIGEVWWNNDASAFKIDWQGKRTAAIIHHNELEVIGNIYENPELLETK